MIYRCFLHQRRGSIALGIKFPRIFDLCTRKKRLSVRINRNHGKKTNSVLQR